MKLYHDNNKIEIGVDEVARGCFFGRVYSAAVIWSSTLSPTMPIKDSK